MLRAGFTVFPMSPRIDPEAITNLLIRAKVDYIFTSSEPAIRALGASAVAKVPEDAQGPSPAIQILSMPSFEELFPCNVEDAAYPVHTPLYDTKQSTIILHTSGACSVAILPNLRRSQLFRVYISPQTDRLEGTSS